MTVKTAYVELMCHGNAEVVEITRNVAEHIKEAGLKSGTATIFVPGATGALTTVEFEPGLVQDMKDIWERVAPSDHVYNHDRAWGDGNGHSHIRASLIGPSLVVPFVNSELTLGTWQQIVFLDFDVRPRKRKLVVQLMGE